MKPRSFKGYIPGWFGSEFEELTNNGNREIVAEWIYDGTTAAITGKSLGRGMVARHFGERQAIKMPSFNRRMPIEDLIILVDYVLMLRSFGALRSFEWVSEGSETYVIGAPRAVEDGLGEAGA